MLNRAANVAVAALLVLSSGEAPAAMLGSLTTSVGVFAALAALVAVKVLTVAVAGGLVPTTSVVLVVFVGAALLWRARRRAPAAAAPTMSGLMPLMAPRPATRLVPPRATPLPAGWELSDLMGTARRHFVQLQAAWDAGDIDGLQALTTPNMLDDLRVQLPECGLAPNRTEVMTLHADLLAFEDLASAYLLSVEFSGLIRESSHAGAVPFREVWMLAQAKHEPPRWRLARQQALL